MVKGYHAVLGVRPDASRDEILHAYSALVKQFHPDYNHARGAAAKFRRIQQAFEMLYEPERHQRKVGAFHTAISALTRVRSVGGLRKRGSAPNFSQGFAPLFILLTVLYVIVAVLPIVLMGVDDASVAPGLADDYRETGAVFFAVATLLYIIAMAAVVLAINRRR
jgi:hypothetical protein